MVLGMVFIYYLFEGRQKPILKSQPKKLFTTKKNV